ncbi:hypothetical protein [uncultured Microscilla sp.]|uniref:hypothetical protein n=1 Tax=uncultured Microscilla sp. TaxID=432653 RepID=UPI002627CC00|nr:hypothetical protein [uncultured Microscilla sp.]
MNNYDEDYSECGRCGQTIWRTQGRLCEDCIDDDMSSIIGEEMRNQSLIKKYFEPISFDLFETNDGELMTTMQVEQHIKLAEGWKELDFELDELLREMEFEERFIKGSGEPYKTCWLIKKKNPVNRLATLLLTKDDAVSVLTGLQALNPSTDTEEQQRLKALSQTLKNMIKRFDDENTNN